LKKITFILSLFSFLMGNSQNLITNGDFENGITGWSGNQGVDVNIVTSGGNSYYSYTVVAPGDPWSANLSYVLPLGPVGKTYILKFDAWSDADRTIISGIGLNQAPWDNTVQTVTLTSGLQSFELNLVSTIDDPSSRVIFDIGAEAGTVNIDNVSLEEVMTPPVGSGPVSPIDFETAESGANWSWTVFENNTNPAVEIIANPDPSGINTSATVMKFKTEEGGMPWAGVESAHGADLGAFEWDANNRIVKIKVWKTIISDVGIKFASNTNWSQGEKKVANTLVNQWEELTFDFSDFINPPTGNGALDQIIIFPDFISGTEPRTAQQSGVSYVDHITFFDESSASIVTQDANSFRIYPNPANDVLEIKSNGVIDRIHVVNLIGQTFIVHSPNAVQSSIDISDLPSGVYIVNSTIQGVRSSLKLIKR
jgi:hypothetical protein